MKRNAFSQLVTWKNDPERKPLIIRGARQVGKTWLMKEFGQSCYESYVYFNFDEEDELRSIFEVNKNPLAGFNKSDSLLNVVLNITEIFADALPRWY